MKFYPELYYCPWTLRIPYLKTTVIYWIKPLFFILLCLTSASGLLFAQTCPCPDCGKKMSELPDVRMVRCVNPNCSNFDKLTSIEDLAGLSGALKGLQLVGTGGSNPDQQPVSVQRLPEPEPEPEGACGGGEDQQIDVITGIISSLTETQQIAILQQMSNSYTRDELQKVTIQYLAQETGMSPEDFEQQLLATSSLFNIMSQECYELWRLPNTAETYCLTSRKSKVQQFIQELTRCQTTEVDMSTFSRTVKSSKLDFNIQELVRLSDSNDLSPVIEYIKRSGEAWFGFNYNSVAIILTLFPLRLTSGSTAFNIQMSFYGNTQLTVVVPFDKIKEMLSRIMAHPEYTDFYAVLFKDKKTDPGPDSKNPESASH
ncbi:hypothetical protein [Endozoicomonas euniceicola]|uniref:Uncharacterized protein n=1 Tax=Endozoicomonas euniceicola TaxID=1234143 RepID=A0ABY6GXI9_9GAMM|nr:hypothetical protein [Endozoicomonas euniceicola]UYM17282.1 hypothetical protein NX720_04990 [Endozoicomonas euniceicola]